MTDKTDNLAARIPADERHRSNPQRMKLAPWTKECKWLEIDVLKFQNDNTCSLFRIQQETTGGLLLKEQVTRAARPAFSVRCCGGFLNSNAAPAKTKQSQCFDSESRYVLRYCCCKFS